MRNDTDIRKEAYRRILKRELCWWLVAIAGGLLLAGVFSGSGIVNLFLHGFQGIGSCWAGIICLVVTGYIAYSLLGILREKRKLIGHGIQAEAVVTAILKETDAEKGKETLVAVYEFTLPGGKKRQIKEPIENSRAGHLGLIEVGRWGAGYPSSWTATIRTPFTYIYTVLSANSIGKTRNLSAT